MARRLAGPLGDGEVGDVAEVAVELGRREVLDLSGTLLTIGVVGNFVLTGLLLLVSERAGRREAEGLAYYKDGSA